VFKVECCIDFGDRIGGYAVPVATASGSVAVCAHFASIKLPCTPSIFHLNPHQTAFSKTFHVISVLTISASEKEWNETHFSTRKVVSAQR
jgi:hypothetical protein